MKKFAYSVLSIVVGATFLISLDSCRKKEDTIARITVRDTANMLVPNARVILYGQSTTDPIQPVVRRDTAYTNGAGVATFNYNDYYQLGQGGFAVLNINAKKDDLTGGGMIKIEPEQENKASVNIQ